ncbi:Manganese-dependent inorganic pyrophosphatase [Candidatus Syntrophocurvum alkaliphilum]|uniref:inorganic diphosphatase n=2 Tax=Candidatus Syntrophocurvum alkaliphilum TaxID=2293317 RepID=A0A6I6D908_9FIRM|nr:Manganese-dependent inorganic pyrophosphatase [Candidatus Syntrophocurvum alkaliphilum]
MKRHNLKTVPVLDEHKRFLGLITIGDVAMIYMDSVGSGKSIEKAPEILKNTLNQKVANIMKTRDLILFEKHETVEEAKKQMLSTRFRNYPVVNEDNRFMGMISRYDLLKMNRKKVILVDHNEKKQAVDGIEEAEIIEIIDHHRVGDLQTMSPILFKNEPVGSCCTLIAEMFLKEDIYINSSIAGLMLSGIISDTMLFKSPTTTNRDTEIAKVLEKASGLNATEWGKQILEKTNRIDKQLDFEIITEDSKEYSSNNILFAISQVETIDRSNLDERKESLIKTMEDTCYKNNYAFMILMVTDIFEEGTELLLAGEESSIAEEAFGPKTSEGKLFLKGVMSRKKQVVPVIYELLRKQSIM